MKSYGEVQNRKQIEIIEMGAEACVFVYAAIGYFSYRSLSYAIDS